MTPAPTQSPRTLAKSQCHPPHFPTNLAKVMNTGELLDNIIAKMSLQDIANARLVCNFWKSSADSCLRRPHTINHETRQQLCMDANQFGPVDRGTALDLQKYGDQRCTTKSVRDHLTCETCNLIRCRENAIRPPGHLLASTGALNLLATLGANIHGGTRSRLPGTKSHTRPRY